jgi:DNA topoisomerase-6 subunit B
LEDKAIEAESAVQVLRFANRVPLQFDKSACAIVHAIESVNWRSYGLAQPKDSLPQGPYIIAVSVVSPFIKFKNASKETIDGSDELVAEIRLALIQAGQKLSKHIRQEAKANELEEKIRHIEQFGPILVEGLCRITSAPQERKKKAEEGLLKILGRDAKATEQELASASAALEAQKGKESAKLGDGQSVDGAPDAIDVHEMEEEVEKSTSKSKKAPAKGAAKPAAKASAKAKGKSKSNKEEAVV